MKNPEDLFSISGRSVSKGGTLLPREIIGFNAPSEARAVIDTQGSKIHFFHRAEKNETLGRFFFSEGMKKNIKIGKEFHFPFKNRKYEKNMFSNSNIFVGAILYKAARKSPCFSTFFGLFSFKHNLNVCVEHIVVHTLDPPQNRTPFSTDHAS